MTAMKALAHEYRSYGAAGRCAACIAERAELRDLDRTVLDEVERVDYARSAEEIARTITGNAAAETDAALVALAWLADAEMIERSEIHRIVPSGPRLLRLRPARQHVRARGAGQDEQRNGAIMTHHERIGKVLNEGIKLLEPDEYGNAA